MEVTTTTILHFIRKYRQLEKAHLQDGYEFIRKFTDPNDARLFDHMCGHWKSKKKAFASFFLNLSWETQIRICHLWGIKDPEDENYLAIEYQDRFFSKPPATVKALHDLLVFFNNHAVESFSTYERPDRRGATRNIPGITLPVKVPAKKRYGNAANWGDYFLSMDAAENLLQQIKTSLSVGSYSGVRSMYLRIACASIFT